MTKRILILSSPTEAHTVTVRVRVKTYRGNRCGYHTEIVRVNGQRLDEPMKGFVNSLFASYAMMVAARRAAETFGWTIEKLCFENVDDQLHAAWVWDGGLALQVVDFTGQGAYLNESTADRSWHRAEAWLHNQRAKALTE